MEQRNAAASESAKQERSKQQPPPPKLKAFEINKKYFTTIGITPNLTDQSWPLNGIILFEFLMLGSAICCTFVFIIYDAETFGDYTQSVYTGSVVTFGILALVILIVKADKLFAIFNGCDEIVNTMLKYSASSSIFIKTVQFEQKSSDIVFLVIVKIAPACAFLPFLIYTYSIYFTTDLGPAAFQLPTPMWFPFDWRTPFGFVTAIAIQYAMLLCILMVAACVIALGIVIFLYLIASTECIKGSLSSINRCSNTNANQQILGQFIEFIQFYSRVKQLSVYKKMEWLSLYSDIFKHFYTTLFIWSLIVICSAFLMIQLQIMHHSDNLMVLLITWFEIICAFNVLLIACELGQKVHFAFQECHDMIEQLDWYLFPLEIQRMLPLIFNFAQQPVETKCFGSITSDRGTFKNIVKTAFSYFTVLRKFND